MMDHSATWTSQEKKCTFLKGYIGHTRRPHKIKVSLQSLNLEINRPVAGINNI